MRLASYEYKNQYSWGIVISHPRRNGEDWIFNPAATEKAFGPVAGVTSGWAKTMTPLLGEKSWPDTLQAFLALGDEGMQALRRMQDRLLCILKSSDFAVVELYAHRVSEVNLLSPVPMPKLMFGLVANSPSFVRNNASRRHVNMIPQGHQRPIGAMVGHDGIFVGANGYNVELGIVIGKPGKDIPVEEAINNVPGRRDHPWPHPGCAGSACRQGGRPEGEGFHRRHAAHGSCHQALKRHKQKERHRDAPFSYISRFQPVRCRRSFGRSCPCSG